MSVVFLVLHELGLGHTGSDIAFFLILFDLDIIAVFTILRWRKFNAITK
ncbi:hypothetical protein LCGC14_1901360 [marine sediment metagenome]|uniref:Uncharacterized protein n=1 Tax=marine sediment metagenome TaxID=412755 RepID=A0A0F9IUL5_9ZZZZ